MGSLPPLTATPAPVEIPGPFPPGLDFGWHLQTTTSTATKMTVARRAVRMAVRKTDKMAVLVQEGRAHISVTLSVIKKISISEPHAVYTVYVTLPVASSGVRVVFNG